MSYAQALSWLTQLTSHGYAPGLETTRRLAALIGNPQDLVPTIHVAGTNGKGSVCAMLESVYRGAGRRVGLYTSPHLIRFGERIQVNRGRMTEEGIVEGVEYLRGLMERETPDLRPTFFEFTTVLAWWWFAREKCDLTILETGLGGRFDSTNIVTPLVSVITQIGLDHMKYLGPDIPAIAAEKAGIIKNGVPVVSGVHDADARLIIQFKARELDAPLIEVMEGGADTSRLEVGLAGRHQRANAAVAAAVIRLLRFLMPVADEQLAQGIASVDWPGRFQVLKNGGRTMVLDGAHNRDGMKTLVETWSEVFGSAKPTLVIGMLADKEWREMLSKALPLAARVIVVPVASERAVEPEMIRQACGVSGVPRAVRVAKSLKDGLDMCRADPLVLVTGSLYLIGEALELIERAEVDGGSGGSNERGLNAWSVGGR